MAQAATALAPIHVKASESVTSLPASTSEILTSWTAPEIPKTIKASFAAWLSQKDGGANAELHLYRRSGYFSGATLNNARNADLYTAFQEVSRKSLASSFSSSSSSSSHLDPHLRATIGTHLNPDGKIGSIRAVDIGNPVHNSWFSAPTPRLINMLEIGKPVATPDPKEEKIVLLHGYGAGTAFFFQNIANMAGRSNSRLFCLDWLGMGRSSRVPFHIPHEKMKTTESRVEAAESFFVQALEDWREKAGLEKMTLVAHSLGGYLSVAYSLKYPERVSRLVLVSPAGIPLGPEDDTLFKQKDNGKGVEAEVTQSQKEHVPASESEAKKEADKLKKTPTQPASSQQRTIKEPPRMGTKTRTVLTWLWERNTSPFGLIRGSLFFGPLLVGRYTSRRFGTLPEEELKSLHNYCQSIFSARGSSEYCLAHLLAPGAYARSPMVNRVACLPATLPVSFLYGSQDWMDVQGGRESVKRLREAGNRLGSTFVIPSAGHNIHVDNPLAFDALLTRILDGDVDGKSNT